MATACLLQQLLYNASYMMHCYIINYTTRCKIVQMSSMLFTVHFTNNIYHLKWKCPSVQDFYPQCSIFIWQHCNKNTGIFLPPRLIIILCIRKLGVIHLLVNYSPPEDIPVIVEGSSQSSRLWQCVQIGLQVLRGEPAAFPPDPRAAAGKQGLQSLQRRERANTGVSLCDCLVQFDPENIYRGTSASV